MEGNNQDFFKVIGLDWSFICLERFVCLEEKETKDPEVSLPSLLLQPANSATLALNGLPSFLSTPALYRRGARALQGRETFWRMHGAWYMPSEPAGTDAEGSLGIYQALCQAQGTETKKTQLRPPGRGTS